MRGGGISVRRRAWRLRFRRSTFVPDGVLEILRSLSSSVSSRNMNVELQDARHGRQGSTGRSPRESSSSKPFAEGGQRSAVRASGCHSSRRE